MTEQRVASLPPVHDPAATGLRHDLRHTLSTLQTLLSVADVDGDTPAERLRGLVSTARREAGLAVTLLESLLSIVEPSPEGAGAEHATQPEQTCDLGDVLRAAAEVTDGLGRTVTVQAGPALSAPLSRTAMTRVVRNLLSNALAATAVGGCIELRGRRVDMAGKADRDGSSIRLEVHDDGPGIPPAGVYRPGAAGLPVVRSLVLPVGGWLVIGSSHLGGACVSVTLPSAGLGRPT